MANPTRLKHKFGDDAAREVRRRKCVRGLRLDFTDRWGRDAILDLTTLNDRPQLARSLALALFDFCEPSGTIKRFVSIQNYQRRINSYFWPFLSDCESSGKLRILRSQDIDTAILQSFIDWMRMKKLRPRNSFFNYSAVSRIFNHLREFYPRLVDGSLIVPSNPFKEAHYDVAHRAPYSEREALEIERVALKEIRSTILRLKKGSELLSKGKDPRGEGSWSDIGDVLWYVRYVLGGQYLTCDELLDGGHEKLTAAFRTPPYSKREVYGHLYPLIPDLIPPLILITLKTGFNPQPVIDLGRDCLKAVPPPNKVGIAATKFKTGQAGPKTYIRIVDGRSVLGPGGIIRTFLSLTEPCLPFSPIEDRGYLWVGLQPTSRQRFQRLTIEGTKKEVREFAIRNGIMGDDGRPLQLRLARLRPTWLTKRYKAAGNLAAVSKDANHKRISTTRGYVNNAQTLPIHEQTIADSLYDFYNSVRERTLTQRPDDPVQVANAARIIQTTAERAESMLRGEQDTFISACKDFYNRPGGPANTPCDRPWACFTCKNAYWTSRTLPRLLRFLDFVIKQRGVLTADDWKAKFGLPYEAITGHILPAFPPDVVSQARLTAEAEQFIVPFILKTV